MKPPLDGIEKMISTPGSTIKEAFVIDMPDPTASGENDVASPHLFAAINQLLLTADPLRCADSRPQFYFSSAYLAALQKKQWSALSNYEAASSTTPARVRHILVSVHYQIERVDYYQIDNVVLNPEAMVARFLHWLRTDDYHHFCGFSCGPLSLNEGLNNRIGPLPIIAFYDHEHTEGMLREALHDGSILHARRVEFEGTHDRWWGRWEGARVIYGFIRWHPDRKGTLLQVMTANEYLATSAPGLSDDELLGRKLREAAQAIATWEDQTDSCPTESAG